MIVIPDEGAIELMNKTLRAALDVDESYSLRLFRNDLTPDTASTLASFTEATFAGYFRYDLTRAGWSAPTIVDGRAVTEWTADEVRWVGSGPLQDIYGYYVVAPATAKVAWAERFNSPREMGEGKLLIVVPRLTGREEQ